MSEIETSVAENLKAARKARNLSLDQLSKKSGVSKSMLRQIEIGQSSPTISTLWKIANGLQLPFTSLLTKDQPKTRVTDFTSEGPLKAGKKGYRLHPLITFRPERPLEIYYTEIDGGVRFEGEPHKGNARETVLIISGALEVTVGDSMSVGHENQVIQFPAGVAHRYFNPGKSVAKAIMTIDYAL